MIYDTSKVKTNEKKNTEFCRAGSAVLMAIKIHKSMYLLLRI